MGRHGGDHRTGRQAARQAHARARIHWGVSTRMALLLTKQDTAGLMDMERAIKVLESAMIEESKGDTFQMLPVGGGKSKRRTFRLVGGALYGIGRMGVRLHGVQLLDTKTGELLAIVGGDAHSYRIAASMALAARYQSRHDAKTVGILGSGRNALLILQGLKVVRPVEQVNVFSPTVEHRERLAEQATKLLGIPVSAHINPDAAIA